MQSQIATPQQINEAVQGRVMRLNRLRDELGDAGFRKYIKDEEKRYREIMTELEAAFREGQITIKSILGERAPLYYINKVKDLICVVSNLLKLQNPRGVFDIRKVMENELAKIVGKISDFEFEKADSVESQEEEE